MLYAGATMTWVDVNTLFRRQACLKILLEEPTVKNDSSRTLHMESPCNVTMGLEWLLGRLFCTNSI
jgi:hypothetical protein